MNAYQERFKQHPLHNSLVALQAAIERLKLAELTTDADTIPVEPAEVQRAAFSRLLLVSNFISNSVERCDASVWTPTTMNTAHTAVTTLTAAIEQYEASKSVANFEAAGDTALDAFQRASSSEFAPTAKDAEDSFVQFCERAEAGIGSVMYSPGKFSRKK